MGTSTKLRTGCDFIQVTVKIKYIVPGEKQLLLFFCWGWDGCYLEISGLWSSIRSCEFVLRSEMISELCTLIRSEFRKELSTGMCVFMRVGEGVSSTRSLAIYTGLLVHKSEDIYLEIPATGTM